jgi:ECF sigma factor
MASFSRTVARLFTNSVNLHSPAPFVAGGISRSKSSAGALSVCHNPEMMRHILVDAARARASGRRGGDSPRVNLDESIDAAPVRGRELIALDDSLNALAEMDERKARVVELRFFGGLSVEEPPRS